MGNLAGVQLRRWRDGSDERRILQPVAFLLPAASWGARAGECQAKSCCHPPWLWKVTELYTVSCKPRRAQRIACGGGFLEGWLESGPEAPVDADTSVLLAQGVDT